MDKVRNPCSVCENRQIESDPKIVFPHYQRYKNTDHFAQSKNKSYLQKTFFTVRHAAKKKRREIHARFQDLFQQNKLIFYFVYSVAYSSYHEKAIKALLTSSLRSCWSPAYNSKTGNSAKCISQRHNKAAWFSTLSHEGKSVKLSIPILKSLVGPD